MKEVSLRRLPEILSEQSKTFGSRIILVTGPPGSGKSTLSSYIGNMGIDTYDLDWYGHWIDGKWLTKFVGMDALRVGKFAVYFGVSDNMLDYPWDEIMYIDQSPSLRRITWANRVITEDESLVPHYLESLSELDTKFTMRHYNYAKSIGCSYFLSGDEFKHKFITSSRHGERNSKSVRIFRDELYICGVVDDTLIRELTVVASTLTSNNINCVKIAGLGGRVSNLLDFCHLVDLICKLSNCNVEQYGPLYSLGSTIGLYYGTKGFKYVHAISSGHGVRIFPFRHAVLDPADIGLSSVGYGKGHRLFHELYDTTVSLLVPKIGTKMTYDYLSAIEKTDKYGNFVNFRHGNI